MNFKKYNRLLGFLSGFCAFIVYFLTVEPTASYWDCAEYISTSAKLQIGHPPGAPLFQMLGAVFSILAFENTQIAYAINMMSVTSSALTIVFMFWSVSLLGKKILKVKSEISSEESFKIFVSFFISLFTGSLTFTAYSTIEYSIQLGERTESLFFFMWPFYFILALGMGLMSLVAFLQLIEDIHSYIKGDHFTAEVEAATDV